MKSVKPIRVLNVMMTSILDATHGGNEVTNGHTGGIVGLRIGWDGSTEEVIHPVNWTSHKQKQMSYSEFGAEIIVATDAVDHVCGLTFLYQAIFPAMNLKQIMLADLRRPQDTITTIHEPK